MSLLLVQPNPIEPLGELQPTPRGNLTSSHTLEKSTPGLVSSIVCFTSLKWLGVDFSCTLQGTSTFVTHSLSFSLFLIQFLY